MDREHDEILANLQGCDAKLEEINKVQPAGCSSASGDLRLGVAQVHSREKELQTSLGIVCFEELFELAKLPRAATT